MAEKKKDEASLIPTTDELMAMGKAAALAAAGLAATQLGAAVAKRIKPVASFAAAHAAQEFAVDLVAGAAIAAPLVAGLGTWQGADFAKKAGLFVGAGVLLSAGAAPLGKVLDMGVTKVLAMLPGSSSPAALPPKSGGRMDYARPAMLPGGRDRLGPNPMGQMSSNVL